MLKSFASTRWIIRAGIVLAGAAMFVVACVSNDHPRPKCNELADGGTAIEVPEASTYFGLPSTDAQAPEALGMEPDPGPACIDCQQANDVETFVIHDFEQGFAPTWFNYGEPGVPIQPPQVGPGLSNDAGVPPPYWGLQVPDLNEAPGGARCGSKYALRMAGGRFVSWGGGFVSLSVTVRGPANIQKHCPGDLPPEELGIGVQPMSIGETCNFFITPAAGQQSRLGLDVADYEGVSFWARRSPSAQSTLRIAVNDENTAQGLALQVERQTYFAQNGYPNATIAEPACKRVISCCRNCPQLTRDVLHVTEATDMVPAMVTGMSTRTEGRCMLDGEWQPPRLREGGLDRFEFQSQRQPLPGVAGSPPDDEGKESPAPGEWYRWRSVGADGAAYKNEYDAWNRDIKLCCPPTMEEELAPGSGLADLGDPQFGGRGCNPYVFKFDYSSGYFCHDEGDPPLPERNDNRCDDGFEANLVLDTEWRFYKIPWGELRRFTPNRKPVDPSGIYSVALFFGPGFLDTYVDDIGFYRKRR